MLRIKTILTLAAMVLGVNGVAFAGWTPIASVRTPANGTFTTYAQIKTTGLKVEKVGYGCPSTRLNYTVTGSYTNGVPFVYNLVFQGQTQSGAYVYRIADPYYGQGGTIFTINTATQYGQGNCVYNFYAQTLDGQ